MEAGPDLAAPAELLPTSPVLQHPVGDDPADEDRDDRDPLTLRKVIEEEHIVEPPSMADRGRPPFTSRDRSTTKFTTISGSKA
jgi:hypothetical protein